MAEAQAAIDSASDSTLLEQTVQCDYAFVRPPPSGPRKGRGRGRSASPRQKKPRDPALQPNPGQDRSASPRRSDCPSPDLTNFAAYFENLRVNPTSEVVRRKGRGFQSSGMDRCMGCSSSVSLHSPPRRKRERCRRRSEI